MTEMVGKSAIQTSGLLRPFSTLARTRFAGLVLRVGETRRLTIERRSK
jgi:hypothetical protein